MKLYQLKHHEILMNDALFNEERFMEQYRNLFEKQLLFHAISNAKILQAVNICKGSISSKPLLIESLLKQPQLPAFQFLVCKN